MQHTLLWLSTLKEYGHSRQANWLNTPGDVKHCVNHDHHSSIRPVHLGLWHMRTEHGHENQIRDITRPPIICLELPSFPPYQISSLVNCLIYPWQNQNSFATYKVSLIVSVTLMFIYCLYFSLICVPSNTYLSFKIIKYRQHDTVCQVLGCLIPFLHCAQLINFLEFWR